MKRTTTTLHAMLIEEQSMTLDDLAGACGVQVQWLRERVEAQLLGEGVLQRFGSAELARARRLAQCERLFDVNAEAAAFMADLIEEVRRLRRQLALQTDAEGPFLNEPELPK
jgi:chaperone modulatory protein CbpM